MTTFIDRVDINKLFIQANIFNNNINDIIRNFVYYDKQSIKFLKYRSEKCILYKSLKKLKCINTFLPCNTDVYAGNVETIFWTITIDDIPDINYFQNLFCVECGNIIYYYNVYYDSYYTTPMTLRCLCDI